MVNTTARIKKSGKGVKILKVSGAALTR